MFIDKYLKIAETEFFISGYSENTVSLYLLFIKKFLIFIKNKDIELIDLNREIIIEFFSIFSKKTISTMRVVKNAISSFVKILQKYDYCPVNLKVDIKIISKRRKIPEIISIDTVKEMIESLNCNISDDNLIYIRNQAILAILFSTGIRNSELCNLKLSDVNIKKNSIQIKVKSKRSEGKSDYLTVFSKYFQLYIKNYYLLRLNINSNFDNLFLTKTGKPLSKQYLWIVINNISKQSGIKKNIKPHTFRHSLATYLLKKGVDLRTVQEILRHKNISTTEIYTHIYNKNINEALKKIE